MRFRSTRCTSIFPTEQTVSATTIVSYQTLTVLNSSRLPLVPDGSRLEDHRRRRGRPQEDPHCHLQRDVLQAAAGHRAAGIGRPRLGQGLHRGAAAANQATDPVRAGQVRNGGFGSEITS